MNERRWWNGSWSRLTRRDVYVRNAADGRWDVELRRGGPEGRVRTREFGSEREAIEWIEATVVGAEPNWREIAPIGSKVKRRGRRGAVRVGPDGDSGGRVAPGGGGGGRVAPDGDSGGRIAPDGDSGRRVARGGGGRVAPGGGGGRGAPDGDSGGRVA
ncbi:hypothetical protein ACQP1P_44360 [Dactylosporangium sp. CA-052675]|uniref:hypothetical protein n=1 Tax=Dactylosporangium sp. CA-052675 TaxID=3239927 RepID=UPI003D94DBB1